MVYYSTLGFIFVPKMRLPSHHSFRIFPYKPSIVGYPIYENPELAAVVNLLQFLPELFWTTNVETCIVNKHGG